MAGIAFSLFLIGISAFILSGPVSGPPAPPPITKATADVPFSPGTPFFPKAIAMPVDKSPAAPDEIYTPLKDLHNRMMKDRVRIGLVKEYPIGVQKTVGISGQAFDGSICALYLNNKLYEATTCIKGRFFFPRITLLNGKNTIEIMAHEPKGSIVPSNMIELFVDLNRRIIENGRNITRGDTKLKKVCLTFDGGASASCASDILDVLKRYGIRCTFFLTGDFIRNHPYIVKSIIEAGHEVGNHTDTHPHLTRLTSNMRFETLPWVNPEFVHNQLKKAEEAFFRLTGQRMAPFWRAPYGEHNLDILRWAEEIGYIHVSWTCGRILEEGLDTLDWVYDTDSPIYYSPGEIRDKIIHYGEDTPEGVNGGIVLMHLASSRPVQDRIHKQLPTIIEGLRNRGYQLSKVSEIIQFYENTAVKEAQNTYGSIETKENPISKGSQKKSAKGSRRRISHAAIQGKI